MKKLVLTITETERRSLRTSAWKIRTEVFEKWQNTQGAEREFYSAAVDRFDALVAKLDALEMDRVSEDDGEDSQ